MLELLFDYQFARHALFTGLIVGLICPLIGLFIVARRLSVIGEVLSHMSLSGIALGSFLGSTFAIFSPKIFGLIFAVIGAFLVEWLRRIYSNFSEIAIPILLSFGIGLGVVLFSAMKGFNADFTNYLFGDLLAVSGMDLLMTIIVAIVVLAVILVFYKELLAVTFDEEYARVGGIKSTRIQIIFIVLIALTISITVQAVGVMLVSGLMVLPVSSGMMLANGFKQALLYSIIISELSIVIGLVMSYYFDLASGGAIIMAALAILLAVLAYRYFTKGR